MEKKVRSRTLAAGLFFTLFFLGLIVRIYWVQVAEKTWLMERAEQNWQESETVPAKRGIISDRNGKVLAEDGTAFIVKLSPVQLHAKGLERDAAKGLAAILAAPGDAAEVSRLENKFYEMATRKKKDSDEYLIEVEVQTEGYKIDAEAKAQIDELIKELKAKIVLKNEQDGTKTKLDTRQVGITLYETEKRYYPYNRLASHVLGFVDKWGKPSGYGLESSLDELLKGTSGKLERERDLKGVEIPNGKLSYTAPVNGKNVTLTLDQQIQYYVENAIRKVYDKWKPRGVTAIAADPKTMEILAMANMPDYNPNRYWDSKDISVFRNNAISYTYEPGSTFKVVTLAGSMQEKLFNPNDTYQSGSIRVGDATLHDHNVVGWGRISYMEGLLRSSNVAFVKLGVEKLGQEKLRQYIKDFGFGEKTGVDLPGELGGVVQMKYASEFGTSTYGQGLTVTAIQQLSSYGVIANGGKLMKPYIVKEIADADTNETIQTGKPEVIRQVISEETAKQASLALEQVIANQEMGTGRRAFIEGYRAAGKTGTANIVLPGEKGYSSNQWLISFAGFAPVEDPKIVVVLIADVPDLGGDYHKGGEVVAPAFKEIVSQTLSYMGVHSMATAAQKSRFDQAPDVPEVTGLAVSAAKTTLSQKGLKAEVIGNGTDVLKQIPGPGTRVSESQRVYLMTQEEETANVPNLAGKSLRDALEICDLLGIKCKTDGEGYVVSQVLSGDEASRELALILKPAEEAEKVLEQAASAAKDVKNTAKPPAAASPTPKKASASPSKPPTASPTPSPTKAQPSPSKKP
ncbi:penicillin-binding transpeptidase domain-containing protein [Gorillibacterium sp. sgz5001074]|uniref:penicillin-binding transpeptidase domain-containing protein n=1 Tax=Gorillibacterium sp. sgz5001074 TaxID=3446695 RepID=UPI003F674062